MTHGKNKNKNKVKNELISDKFKWGYAGNLKIRIYEEHCKIPLIQLEYWAQLRQREEWIKNLMINLNCDRTEAELRVEALVNGKTIYLLDKNDRPSIKKSDRTEHT